MKPIKKKIKINLIYKLKIWIMNNLGLSCQIKSKRDYYSNYFKMIFGNKIKYGLFKGVHLAENFSWGSSSRAAMLFGLYEQEVLNILRESIPISNRELLIDFGTADGFYSIGCVASSVFKRSICYESSEIGRKSISDTGLTNNISSKLFIRSELNSITFKNLINEGIFFSKSCIICDIEGGEFELFIQEICNHLNQCYLIIEVHDHFFVNGHQLLRDLIEKFQIAGMNVREFNTGARDLSLFPELSQVSDSDRWLICSEGRARLGKWLFISPSI